ncbi:MAG: hypothetical protein IT287_01695 [Bdellovibrionaceae bacterium]|nr:hypothetical protein [Pseudobdellovibrionaceae bacterium]
MLTRRDIIRKATLVVPLLAIPGGIDVVALGRKIKNQTYKTLALFLHKYPMDKIDKNKNYLDGHTFATWHAEIHPYIKNKLPQLVPLNGRVVELGVFKGESSAVLKSVFGFERYMGVDLNPYAQIDGVVQADVRELADLKDGKAAFVWNDVSTWKGSPRSRLAALKWAKRNLAKGGVYIDEGAESIPTDVDYNGLTLVHKGQNFTVFQKA